LSKKRNILQISIILLFLGAYTNVYVTNVMCNIAHYVDLSGEDHSHPMGHDHHSHTDTDHSQSHSHSDKHSHDNNSEDDNCCNDLTSNFISKLDKITAPLFNFEINNIATPTQLILFNSLICSQYTSKHINLADRAPPLTKPHIFILIQSFLI